VKCVDKALRKGFDSLLVLTWWTVWKERNNRSFNGAMQQAATLASWITEEASLWVHAGVAA
jgi:aryl carrier-like protein